MKTHYKHNMHPQHTTNRCGLATQTHNNSCCGSVLSIVLDAGIVWEDEPSPTDCFSPTDCLRRWAQLKLREKTLSRLHNDVGKPYQPGHSPESLEKSTRMDTQWVWPKIRTESWKPCYDEHRAWTHQECDPMTQTGVWECQRMHQDECMTSTGAKCKRHQPH